MEMPRGAIRYAVVDAFTSEPFKGNPAAVCLLEDDDVGLAAAEQWMQSVAAEFNLPLTAFLTRAEVDADDDSGNRVQFNLRWFTPKTEVEICAHATLAAAHFLLTSGIVKCNLIEFITKSGLLTAKKVHGSEHLGASNSLVEGQENFMIELDFPVMPVISCDSTELLLIPETLDGASIINVQRATTTGDLIVELSSGQQVVDIKPNFSEIAKCAGRGLAVTAPAPAGSGYDFFTRFFCPKFGVNEDQVCGSAHCALAPYWGRKLGKQKLTAFMASLRSGTLYLELDDATQRVRILGEAVTIMVGTLLV